MAPHHHNKRNYARPRIQRAFLAWLAESRWQFAVPLWITRRTKQSIELEFSNGQSLISVTVNPWEIIVGFEWQGEYWDSLKEFKTIPERKSNGYVCSLCDSGERKNFFKP